MSKIESVKIYQKAPMLSQVQSMNTPFAQEQNFGVNKENDEKKKGISGKELTNILGVAVGVAAIGGYMLSQARRPQTQKMHDALSGWEKKIANLIESIKEKARVKEPGEEKLGYRLGNLFGDWKESGEELFNNLVYGFGTVVIMPLVILFSPFGKKKSSTEDKVFTILRQPLSFVTMFSMQLTVDKFLKGLVPKFVAKNAFEIDGKQTDIKDIKFNDGLLKSHFISEMEKLNIPKNEITDLFKLGDQKLIEEQMGKLLKEIGQDIQLPTMAKKLDNYFKASGRSKLLTQFLVVVTNVLFSAPIGCTMLNVFYGKMMKSWKSQKQGNNAPNESVKGGH